jgi:hypothetical protein
MGAGEFGIRLPGNIVPQSIIASQDSESDDVPLVSKRAAGSRTLDILDVAANEAPVVALHLSSCSIEQQQQAGSPALFGVSGVGAVANAAAGSGAGVLSLLAGARSSSPVSCFRPHPAWPAEAGHLLYVAVFLTQESRDVLLAMVPPLHPLVTADHMTLAYKPISMQQLLSFPLGASVQLSIIGSAADSRAQAVAADPPPWLPPTASVSTHVTISVALGAKAVEAGHLIRDALQRTATADPAGPVVSGAGTYQHFDEPLQLVGRLGVQVALPSGQAVVVYSVDELAAGGHISLCRDDIDTFYSMHSERVKKVSGLLLGGLGAGCRCWLLVPEVHDAYCVHCYNQHSMLLLCLQWPGLSYQFVSSCHACFFGCMPCSHASACPVCCPACSPCSSSPAPPAAWSCHQSQLAPAAALGEAPVPAPTHPLQQQLCQQICLRCSCHHPCTCHQP